MQKLFKLYDDHPIVKEVIDKLENSGFEAYIVGGAVRDSLLGRDVDDIDITTNATPYDIAKIFPKERVIPTGIKFGTVMVLGDDENVEVTTFRTDGFYEDGRRPESVKFCRTLEEDLGRRDFTINAIAFNPNVGLVDPYNGLNDIFLETVKTVGDPIERFTEDSLRILRAIRFATTLGFTIEEETLSAAHFLKNQLRRVSGPRIGKELSKMLVSGNFSNSFDSYQDIIIAAVPELSSMKDYSQHNKYHHYNLWDHTMLLLAGVEKNNLVYAPKGVAESFMWAAMFHDCGKPAVQSTGDNGMWHYYSHEQVSANMAKQAMQRMALPRQIVNATYAIIQMHGYPLDLKIPLILRFLNRLSDYYPEPQELFIDMVIFKMLDKASKKDSSFYLENLNNLPAIAEHFDYDYKSIIKNYASHCMFDGIPYTIKMMPITGEDLMEATSREAGPWIDKTLEVTLRHIMGGLIGYSKDEVLAEAIKMSSNFKD